jgi:hypothetical protein
MSETKEAAVERYFSFDVDGSLETFATEAEAKERAEMSLTFCRDEAAGDGWPESTQDICYGKIIGRVIETSRKQRPPDSEINENEEGPDGTYWGHGFDTTLEYELTAAQPESHWTRIRTADDLPKVAGHYWWQTDDGDLIVIRYSPDFSPDVRWILNHCIAYMPITKPQPYQEGKDEK